MLCPSFIGCWAPHSPATRSSRCPPILTLRSVPRHPDAPQSPEAAARDGRDRPRDRRCAAHGRLRAGGTRRGRRLGGSRGPAGGHGQEGCARRRPDDLCVVRRGHAGRPGRGVRQTVRQGLRRRCAHRRPHRPRQDQGPGELEERAVGRGRHHAVGRRGQLRDALPEARLQDHQHQPAAGPDARVPLYGPLPDLRIRPLLQRRQIRRQPAHHLGGLLRHREVPGQAGRRRPPDPHPGIFEAALLADGVGPSKLYPLDTKRALRKWDGIKSDLTYWKTGAQQTQIAQSGQADMIMAWSGRIYEANANGANFRPVWNNSFTLYDVFAVPKGSKNTKAAMGLINYALGEEQQTRQSEYTSYAPVNVNSKPTLSPQAQKLDPTQEKVLNQSITPDFTYWGQNRDKLSTAWTDWLNR
ncbi:extracellular solute-binding protein [Streptomyces sp. FXJ1.4098]|nr:extracellular solute-binding protein [Streptomyces sp. FXJ1.4098]